MAQGKWTLEPIGWSCWKGQIVQMCFSQTQPAKSGLRGTSVWDIKYHCCVYCGIQILFPSTYWSVQEVQPWKGASTFSWTHNVRRSFTTIIEHQVSCLIVYRDIHQASDTIVVNIAINGADIITSLNRKDKAFQRKYSRVHSKISFMQAMSGTIRLL